MQTRHSLQQAKDTNTVSQTHAPALQQGPTLLTKPPHPATLIQRAAADPRSLSRAEVLQLQRTIGNRAVGALLRVQPKLTVGPGRMRIQPLDHSRRSDVTQEPTTAGVHAAGRTRARPPVVQASLVVAPPGDRHEGEADAIADDIIRRLQRSHAPGVDATGGAVGSATVHRQPSGPVVGLAGGAVDAATTGLIEGARGRGAQLPDDVRRSMEEAFGADFAAVRVHDDASSHEANVRLTARAFTTGTDIFFGTGAYRPSAPTGKRLIAHELAHVVQQGGAGTARRSATGRPLRHVQRELKYGKDPKTMITKDNKDLLYGINIPRGETKGGLSNEQRSTIRTIDDYNRAIGINAVMTSTNAAMGLYDVRAQLALPLLADWQLPGADAKLNTPTNKVAIDQWVVLLRQNGPHIGLEDLGEKGGLFSKNKINKKSRFKKNRKESQASQPKADQLTSTDTRRFLSANHTAATAKNAYDAMSTAKQKALNEWVYRAFFRRTSKLGQDFAIKVLNATVHFNTIADPDYQPLLGPQWQEHGLDTMSATGGNTKNRAITVSEFRHMQKLAAQYPNQFNVYGEI